MHVCIHVRTESSFPIRLGSITLSFFGGACGVQYAAQLQKEESVWGSRVAAYLLKVRPTAL